MAERRPAPRAGGALSVAVAAAAMAAFVAVEPSCLDARGGAGDGSAEGRCASCHGAAERGGDFLQRSAPPRDLLGATDPAFAGVGAHQIHLQASETHGAVACAECHLVPETVGAPGHADDPRPAEITFGSVARTGDRQPSYDATAQRCADSWCHRSADAVWTAPRTSELACGSCHALPPPLPHPPSQRCADCHAEVIDAERRFVRPELHVDGKVQAPSTGCTGCHGSGDDPAPPADTSGNTAVSAIGVGAHQAHLEGGAASRPLACNECHLVPDAVDAPGHIDAAPAEVVLAGVATTGGLTPVWDASLASCSDSWCHGPSAPSGASSPPWTEPGPLPCGGCHGTPPPAPHPQITDCSRCHGEVVAGDDLTIGDRLRHVDGVIDVAFAEGCTACHGGENPAPPLDLSGMTETSEPGVGAHQIHLAGTPRSRAVPCGECHLVPEETFAPGHLDSLLPAEVVFSGAAVAFGAAPVYSGGSCQGSACHGAQLPDGHASGGTLTEPSWTVVDGTQAACGTCHALPPPAPHPKAEFNPVCSACHENIAPDNATFVAPALHVDGVVTFDVP
jgi:predicted CxxxxCH...CXXCH cytochrome family protein